MGEGSILNDYWSNNKTLFSFSEPIIKISSVSLHTWLNYEEERRGEVTKHQGEGKPVILFLSHFIFSLQFSAFWLLRSSLTSTLTRLTLHTSKAEKQGRETFLERNTRNISQYRAMCYVYMTDQMTECQYTHTHGMVSGRSILYYTRVNSDF